MANRPEEFQGTGFPAGLLPQLSPGGRFGGFPLEHLPSGKLPQAPEEAAGRAALDQPPSLPFQDHDGRSHVRTRLPRGSSGHLGRIR